MFLQEGNRAGRFSRKKIWLRLNSSRTREVDRDECTVVHSQQIGESFALQSRAPYATVFMASPVVPAIWGNQKSADLMNSR